MKKNEIQVGGHYVAKVSGKLTTVRVDAIRENELARYLNHTMPRYDVTNLSTGRKTTFRSAAKFRCKALTQDMINETLDRRQDDNPKLKPGETSTTHRFELAGLGNRISNDRSQYVFRLWLLMPPLTNKTVALWIRFNEVINRKFGPPKADHDADANDYDYYYGRHTK